MCLGLTRNVLNYHFCFLIGLLKETLLKLAKQQAERKKAEKQIGEILPQGVSVLNC